MDNQKETVASKEFWQIGILMLARDDFVHRELYSLETPQLLNLTDHRGLIDLNDGALGVGPQEMEQPGAGDAPDDEACGSVSAVIECADSNRVGKKRGAVTSAPEFRDPFQT